MAQSMFNLKKQNEQRPHTNNMLGNLINWLLAFSGY